MPDLTTHLPSVPHPVSSPAHSLPLPSRKSSPLMTDSLRFQGESRQPDLRAKVTEALLKLPKVSSKTESEPDKLRDDFITMICEKTDALKIAELLQGILDHYDIYWPKERESLYELLNQLPYPSLKSIIEITDKFRLGDATSSHQRNVIPLLLCIKSLVVDQGFTAAELWEAAKVFSTRVPKISQHFSPDQTDPVLMLVLEKYAAGEKKPSILRFAPWTRQVMGYLPRISNLLHAHPNDHLPLAEYLSRILGDMHQIKTVSESYDINGLEVGKKLLAFSDSLSDYHRRVLEYTTLMKNAPKWEFLKEGLRNDCQWIYKNLNQESDIQAALSLVQQIGEKSLYPISLFNSQSNADAMLTAEKIMTDYGEFSALLKKYPTHADHEALSRLVAMSLDADKFGISLMSLLDLGMQYQKAFQTSPESLPDLVENNIRYEFILKLEAFRTSCQEHSSLKALQNEVAHVKLMDSELPTDYVDRRRVLEFLKASGHAETTRKYVQLKNHRGQLPSQILSEIEGSLISDNHFSKTLGILEFKNLLAILKQDVEIAKTKFSEKDTNDKYTTLITLVIRHWLQGEIKTDDLKAYCLFIHNNPGLSANWNIVSELIRSTQGKAIQSEIPEYFKLLKRYVTVFTDNHLLKQNIFSHYFNHSLKSLPVSTWGPSVEGFITYLKALTEDEQAKMANTPYSGNFIYRELPEQALLLHRKTQPAGDYGRLLLRLLSVYRQHPTAGDDLLLPMLKSINDLDDRERKLAEYHRLISPGFNSAQRKEAIAVLVPGLDQTPGLTPLLEESLTIFDNGWNHLKQIMEKPALIQKSGPWYETALKTALIQKSQAPLTRFIDQFNQLKHYCDKNPGSFEAMRDLFFSLSADPQITQDIQIYYSPFDELHKGLEGKNVKKRLTVEDIRVFHRAIQSWHENFGDSRELLPLLKLSGKVVQKFPPEKWPGILEGLRQGYLTLANRDRLGFDLSAFHAYFNTVLELYAKHPMPEPIGTFLKTVLENHRFLAGFEPNLHFGFILCQQIAASRSVADFQSSCLPIRTLLDGEAGNSEESQAERKKAASDFIKIISTPFLDTGVAPIVFDPVIGAQVVHALAQPDKFRKLLPVLSSRILHDMPSGVFKPCMRILLKNMDRNTHPALLASLPEVIQNLFNTFPDNPELCQTLLDEIVKLPGEWITASKRLSMLDPDWLKKLGDNDYFYKVLDETERQNSISTIKLFLLLPFPNKFLNHYMLNVKNIRTDAVDRMFHQIEYGNADAGTHAFPELLAMSKPYLAHVKNTQPGFHKPRINQVSAALTRVYNFLGSVNTLQGIALNNWIRSGTLALSFTKWQYDAMRLWKGAGPSEKDSLLAQSGLFKPTPKRDNDKTYHGGYSRYNPETGVSIELRRAYLVISKPGLGTVVIRNSSPVFGRNLMQDAAYYSPDKIFTDETNLFNPDTDLGKHFQGLYSVKLNHVKLQKETHQKIQALFEAFDEEMAPYTAWKCGFKDGKPPAGFREMLRLSLLSAKNDGAMSPFGKKKNIRLAWVNPLELPLPVRTFDITNPVHQREAETYLAVADKKIAIQSTEDYEKHMPELMSFLKAGLADNLELVLTETVDPVLADPIPLPALPAPDAPIPGSGPISGPLTGPVPVSKKGRPK